MEDRGTMDNCTIRRAVPQDMDALTELWEEMMRFHAGLDARIRPAPDGTHPWREYMQNLLEQEDACVLVAEAEGRAVGYIVGYMQTPPPVFRPSRYGYVSDICVAADARRRGIGRALFEHLIAWFQEQEADHVELSVAARNTAAQAFWRKMGCQDYMHRLWYPLSKR